MRAIADIHCHILPYVDDGAEHMSEMEELLTAEVEQGVRRICFTPHLRTDMFQSSDEEVRRRFQQAKEYVEKVNLPVQLYLGREHYCDKRFLERLEAGELLTMGEGKSLLMEFSSRDDMDTICGYIRRAMEAGFQPLVAHVERYPATDLDPEQVRRLRDMSAKIQVNAGSLLGREGLRQKRFSWKLLKLGLVDAVASDAHDPEYRPPELGECARKVENKMGEAYARKVLWESPLEILSLE